MTGVTIKFEARELQDALRVLARVGREPTALLDDVAERVLNSTQDRIVDGGPAPDGSPWKPWNPLYAAGRRNGAGGKLNLTGALRATMTKEVAGRTARVGSNRPYAAIHQFGGTIRPKTGKALKFKLGGGFVTVASVTIPARPFLGISADDQEEIRAIFADHVARATRRA